jgi:acyl-CoA synthetase (AMP-forming)/AMP-acid ligase II
MLLEAIASAMPDRPRVGRKADAVTAAGAAVFVGLGADAVGFLGVSSAAFPACLFASAMAGVPFTPLNYRLSADQLAGLAGQVLTTRQWQEAAAAADPLPPREVDDECPARTFRTPRQESCRAGNS